MAKYILEDILRVRNFRKDVAEKNLTQAQRLVVEAEENVKRAEQALEEFKVFIVTESDRLYKEVIGQKVKKLSVDGLNAALRALKNKLFDYEKNVENEKENLEKAKKNLAEKRIALQEANKNIEKISAHKESWIKEAKHEEEMLADKELEEFTGKKQSSE
ncbi:MAG: type III secretion protein [Puniceicoccales bacterium]|jgi:F0F1-type ATP synthase membrane subunit b/b'|nr:type III secretion protein [Puniceicoccales bacterium]